MKTAKLIYINRDVTNSLYSIVANIDGKPFVDIGSIARYYACTLYQKPSMGEFLLAASQVMIECKDMQVPTYIYNPPGWSTPIILVPHWLFIHYGLTDFLQISFWEYAVAQTYESLDNVDEDEFLERLERYESGFRFPEIKITPGEIEIPKWNWYYNCARLIMVWEKLETWTWYVMFMWKVKLEKLFAKFGKTA